MTTLNGQLELNVKVQSISDRSELPATELLIGLNNTSVNIRVICNPNGREYAQLQSSNVTVIDLIVDKCASFSGIKKLKSMFNQQQSDLVYGFNNRAISNAFLSHSFSACWQKR